MLKEWEDSYFSESCPSNNTYKIFIGLDSYSCMSSHCAVYFLILNFLSNFYNFLFPDFDRDAPICYISNVIFVQ